MITKGIASLAILATFVGTAVAEEKVCVPSPCAGVPTALEFARSHAVSIYVGTFELGGQKRETNNAADHSAVSTHVDFVPKYEIGNSSKVMNRFRILVNKLLLSSAASAAGSASEEAKKNWLSVLRDGKTSRLAEYEQSEKTFSTYLEGVQIAPFNFALARVDVGTLERKFRVANVPILEQQDYVLLLLRSASSSEASLLPRDFDLYPFDAYQRLK